MSYDNPSKQIAEIEKIPITYLFECCKQANNNQCPQFETTISHITNNTVYFAITF